KRIAQRVHAYANLLAYNLKKIGCDVGAGAFFDMVRVRPPTGIDAGSVLAKARKLNCNLRDFSDGSVGIALDETTTQTDIANLISAFTTASDAQLLIDFEDVIDESSIKPFARTSAYLTHPVFSRYHSETEMLRYIFTLMNRDLSLAQSMIPLGSCTM